MNSYVDTTLQGAVIASEASNNKNYLSTDRLLVSDIKNNSDIKSQAASLSYSGATAGFTDARSGVGGTIPLLLKESDSNKTRSAVSPGTIEVRNAAGANDLVGLNRDTANANKPLDRPDEKAMQERIDLIQSSAQLSSTVINKVAEAKANKAAALSKQADDQAKAGSPDAEQTALAANAAYLDAKGWQVGGDKRVMADIATGLIAAGLGGATGTTAVGIVANTSSSDIFKKIGDYAQARSIDPKSDAATRAAWAEGGAARVMLHALAGAAIGLSSGSPQSGALGAGASAALIPAITDALEKNQIKGTDQDALASLIAAGVGTVVGAGNGVNGSIVAGGTANSVEVFNRRLHKTQEVPILEKKAEELEKRGKAESSTRLIDLLMIAAGGAVDKADEARLNALVQQSKGKDTESERFMEDLNTAKGIVAQLAAQEIPLTWKDGTPIMVKGEKVYAFGATESQKNDPTLFNAANVYGPGAVYDQWRQYGQEQTAQHQNELSGLSTYESSVADASQRLADIAIKGTKDVTPELDILAAVVPAARGAKTVFELILESIAIKRLASGAELNGAAKSGELIAGKNWAGAADNEAGLAGRPITVVPGRFDNEIDLALKSDVTGEVLEGQVGRALSEKGMLLDYQSKFRSGFVDGKPVGIGEIDAETPRFIIEVASSPKPGKIEQLQKLQNNTMLNPDRKEIILFAPNVVKPQQIKAYEKVGVKVINSVDELFEYGAKKGGL